MANHLLPGGRLRGQSTQPVAALEETPEPRSSPSSDAGGPVLRSPSPPSLKPVHLSNLRVPLGLLHLPDARAVCVGSCIGVFNGREKTKG